jgi:hypothetical protein
MLLSKIYEDKPREYFETSFSKKNPIFTQQTFFLYKQKSNVHHSIEVSLKIYSNKLQERTQSEFYQITQPYPDID